MPVIPLIEALRDEDLERLNKLLPWQCFTLDGHGRHFGKAASSTKRAAPQPIPDRRILDLASRIDLSKRTVLEIGCFEGIHTIALCQQGADVRAVDSRLENVVKTIVRCAFYGFAPRVFVHDVDRRPDTHSDLKCDVCVHIGVLYHLADPVRHLRELGSMVGEALLLDTHYAAATDAQYESGGETFRYHRHVEGGRSSAFSGMHDHAKWLLLDDILSLLGEAGFARREVLQKRDERYGPRVLIFAQRDVDQPD